jgi:Tol biopolymer transport system component
MLTPGTRLGAYEVATQLGVGGMGEVYRATDTSLRRQVALKVLPDAVAADGERLARFQREAEVLAALNHPNIAAIYGVERSGAITALVLELVEGPTLADRIADGPIPVSEAVAIARQIAAALEAAHAQGIIHRDLKPANVKVRADGMVKVLDFGLAKAIAPAMVASSPNGWASPTITAPAMTEAGIILGTAAYMAPEQARGRSVDTRADIWALGCVLYEMLTGQRAFPGEDVAETLARVVEGEPDWAALPPTLSPVLRAFLRRSLHKRPEDRLRDVGDLRLALDGAFDGPLPTGKRDGRATGRASRWMVRAITASAMLALVALATTHLREPVRTTAPEMRVDITTPSSLDPLAFAISPDGQQMVFVASGDGPSRLWLRPLAGTTAKPLAGTERARSPFWSPDSRSVGFFAEGALKRLDLHGGQPRVLARADSRTGGTWGRGGVILFRQSVVGGALSRVSAEGGSARSATTLERQRNHSQPQFLADGQHFLFNADGPPDARGLFLGSLDSPQTTRLTAEGNLAGWMPKGWVLWVRDQRLVAQRLDLNTRSLVGEQLTVADSPGAVSVSASGVIAYRSSGSRRGQLRLFSRDGEDLGTLGPPADDLSNPRVSPDGERVMIRRLVQNNWDLWLMEGTRISRFTFDKGTQDSPVWSPDGKQILFRSDLNVLSDLYVKPANGGSNEAPLLQTPAYKTPSDWSTDGRFALFHIRETESDFDLWVLPVETRKPWLFLKTPFNERHGNLSPDSRWVAYMSNESGRTEVYVRPFVRPTDKAGTSGPPVPQSGGQWQISTIGGIFPRWSRDGRELYYLDPDAQMIAVPIRATGASLEPGDPAVLFQTRISEGGEDIGQGPRYDVTRDGRFLIVTEVAEAEVPITLLLNWSPPASQ